ncbi:MAG TPA: hypothetical protein VLA16_11190 [Ideonella sp.]|nr:hypothetical protein [Ideonella sp.]
MTVSTLRFAGTHQQARAQLVQLLKDFPQVLFRERAPTEYEVTAADTSALQRLATRPGWSLAQPH